MRPYPVDRLRRFSHAQAVELTRWARAAPLAALRRRGQAAREWLGAPLDLDLGAAVGWTDDAPASEAVYVLLEGVRPAGLVLDIRVANALVERTLGADGEAIDARGPLGEVERGVLAYAVGRWLGEGTLSVGTVFAYAPALAEAVGPRLVWPFELTLGSARGHGALWLPEPVGVSEAAPRAAPPWLPIVMTASAGDATLPAHEVAGLSVGDVLLPDDLTVDLSGAGTVTLRAPRAPLGFVCSLEAGALTVRRIRADTPPALPGRRVTNEGEEPMAEDMIAKLSDTPVTLHIELARLELRLGEVASLAVGEVLRTAQPVTDRVSLTAGERAVAYGALVDVDGELGVQITEVLASSSTTE